MTNQERIQAMREKLNRLKERNDQLEASMEDMHQRLLKKDEIQLSLGTLINFIWPERKNKKPENSGNK